jgi:hypothetical protein
MEITPAARVAAGPTPVIAEWAAELKQAEFTDGTIVGADIHLTGNLRAAFPRARVIDASAPPAAYPDRRTRLACLDRLARHEFQRERNVAIMPELLSTYLTKELKVDLRGPGRAWRHPARSDRVGRQGRDAVLPAHRPVGRLRLARASGSSSRFTIMPSGKSAGSGSTRSTRVPCRGR